MQYFQVIYTYAPDDQNIIDTRPVHRKFLGELKEAGTLVGSGPFEDAEGGALIVIRLADGATVADAEKLMDNDPFTQKNLLSGRSIRPWNPVLNIFG